MVKTLKNMPLSRRFNISGFTKNITRLHCYSGVFSYFVNRASLYKLPLFFAVK